MLELKRKRPQVMVSREYQRYRVGAHQPSLSVQLIQEIGPENSNDLPDLSMGNLEINDYSQSLIEFTEKDRASMRTLPNKECMSCE
jgi:hypothetical protein